MSSSRARYVTVAAGVVGTFASFGLVLWILSQFDFFTGLLAVGLGVVGAPIAGGFVAGYLTTGTRRDAAVNGLLTGILAGVVLGFLGATAFAIGTRTHPPTRWTLSDLLALAAPVAFYTGTYFGPWSLVSGYLGYRTRQRDG